MATEQQHYRVVRKEDSFEIRFYPPANIASVDVAGGYDRMRNEGFRELAGYIFGGNSRGEKIAMTAPVIMDLKDENQAGTMSFVMPSSFDMNAKPAPQSSRITFAETEPAYVAALTFGGFASIKDLEEHKARLLKLLEEKHIKYDIHAEYMLYDPPYKLLMRRNEVAVKLIDFNE